MHRNITNIIRHVMDEYVPGVIRDSRWFMYPFFWVAYKGKDVSRMMDFKRIVQGLSDEEYRALYAGIRSIGNARETSLNTKCQDRIRKACSGGPFRILDLGCGGGYLVRLLEGDGHEVWGADMQAGPHPGVKNYVSCMAEELPFPDGHFDIVVCTHTLEHLRRPGVALAEMKRVSKDRLIIVVPRQKAFRYTLDEHINFYPEADLLVKEIGEKNYVCEDLDGDWFFEAYLRGPYKPR